HVQRRKRIRRAGWPARRYRVSLLGGRVDGFPPRDSVFRLVARDDPRCQKDGEGPGRLSRQAQQIPFRILQIAEWQRVRRRLGWLLVPDGLKSEPVGVVQRAFIHWSARIQPIRNAGDVGERQKKRQTLGDVTPLSRRARLQRVVRDSIDNPAVQQRDYFAAIA